MKNILNYSNKEISDLLNIDINKVKELKKVIRCKDIEYLLQHSSDCNSWNDQCFNTPSLKELQMYAINEILHGYGIESIQHEQIYISSYYGHICAEYVNLGDTYIMTILLDHITNKFVLCSWGDYYEKYLMKYDN
jgi:hypothetical protein